MAEYSREAKRWFTILDAVLKLPGTKIDREVFLQKTFEKYCDSGTVNKILQDGPEGAGVDITLMEKVSGDVIAKHTNTATLISAAAGLPGGLAMAATIPADVVQFYHHVVVAAQQIAYVYGFQSVEEADFKSFLTLLIGQMAGVEEADNALNEIAAEQFTKKMSKITMGKILDKTVTRVAVVIGVHLGKRSVLKIVTKAVPLVGGLLSGGMTFFSFKPMCNNLERKLYNTVETNRNKTVQKEVTAN